jgi:hypothetical protein
VNEIAESLPMDYTDAGLDWETLDSRVSTAIPDIESALEKALAATRDVAQWVERLRALSVFVRQIESGLMEVQQRLEPPSGRPAKSVAHNVRADARHLRVFEPTSAEPEMPEEPLASTPEALEKERGAEAPEVIAATEVEEHATAGEPVSPSTMVSKLLKQLMGGQH